MMIPGELFTITNYQTINNFLGLNTLGRQLNSEFLMQIGNWSNTYTVLIIPFLVSIFYIYLLKQNFMQIPNELYLAAKVDGTTDLKYLWKVMIPLALPTIISITILKMMGAWNSYVWPRLVANDDANKLITNGLRGADFTVDNMIHYPRQMAAVAIKNSIAVMGILLATPPKRLR
jgi:multiple sugar transport system permease protein